MDENQQYRHAAVVLRSGGIVALPTDTVYGLCAVATDGAAVERIYEIKGRDAGQALPIFVGSTEQAELIAELTAPARALAAAFWPGALTMVLRRKPAFATRAATGGDTIAVRVPGDAVIRELALQLGPLTGTSANRAGREECHTAAEVREQLGEAVDLVVDAAVAATGQPSTVVDCTEAARVRVLRDGAVARGALETALAGVAALI
jgi:L-threonylcarbamoyladenylate synthase